MRVKYYVAFVAATLVFAAAAILAARGVPAWEASFFRGINNWPSGGSQWLVTLFGIVTFFGSTWIALISVAGAFVMQTYRLAWRLALHTMSAYALITIAKQLIDRGRPAELLTDVHARASEASLGFPSGHAAMSTVLVLTLWPYLPPKARYVIVVLFVGAVSLSRIYLGVHFPLDIVGGVAIGVAVVLFWRLLPRKIQRLIRVS